MEIASTELPAPFSFKVGMKLSDDGDLLSSIFRDHYGGSASIGRSLRVILSEPTRSPGKQYFSPLASGILNIGKKLIRDF